VELLAQRVVWSLVFLFLLLAIQRNWRWLGEVVRKPRVLAAFAASALLLSINWIAYIWAVGRGHVLDASLGYFMNPLVNVALGCAVLHERLRPPQWIALALALGGVLWLTVLAGHPPWISLVLAGSFGIYGLLRKVATLGALEGLALETLLLTPLAVLALAWLWSHGETTFPAPELSSNLWLLGVGPVTSVPLLLFAAGARRLRLATLGVIQYISPTMQFLLGVLVFDEPFSAMRLAGFSFIWVALLIYTVDGLRRSTAAPVSVTA
jgi:chloramphenicol-sensitive protein RarD